MRSWWGFHFKISYITRSARSHSLLFWGRYITRVSVTLIARPGGVLKHKTFTIKHQKLWERKKLIIQFINAEGFRKVTEKDMVPFFCLNCSLKFRQKIEISSKKNMYRNYCNRFRFTLFFPFPFKVHDTGCVRTLQEKFPDFSRFSLTFHTIDNF